MFQASVLAFAFVAFNISTAIAQTSEEVSTALEAPAFTEPTVGVEAFTKGQASFTSAVLPVVDVALVCEDQTKGIEVTIKERTVRFPEGEGKYVPAHSIQLKVEGVVAGADQMTPGCQGVCQAGQHCAATVGEARYVIYPDRISAGYKAGVRAIRWKKNGQAEGISLACRSL